MEDTRKETKTPYRFLGNDSGLDFGLAHSSLGFTSLRQLRRLLHFLRLSDRHTRTHARKLNGVPPTRCSNIHSPNAQAIYALAVTKKVTTYKLTFGHGGTGLPISLILDFSKHGHLLVLRVTEVT